MMTIFKVSYVIIGNDHPGTILNQENVPREGEQITLGNNMYEIVEVFELVPPRGEFHYIHATCRPLKLDSQ